MSPSEQLASKSALLQLPSELRNQITKYALTTEHGLNLLPGVAGQQPPRFFERRSSEWAQPRAWQSSEQWEHQPEMVQLDPDKRSARKFGFNQIRSTCRQLYHETAGLEIQFNHVHVFNKTRVDSGPAQLFCEFLVACTISKAGWFRNVSLCYKSPPEEGDHHEMELPNFLAPIAELCRKHPHLKVCYETDGLDVSSTDMFRVIPCDLFLNFAFRGKDLRHLVSIDSLYLIWLNHLEKLRWCKSPQRAVLMDLPNFRFMPPVTGKISRAAIIKEVSKCHWLGHDTYVDLITGWIEEGIRAIQSATRSNMTGERVAGRLAESFECLE
jgi:hypothetical protein